VKRLEFCHTPKHGSWLSIAENGLSALTKQCVHGHRFGTMEELCKEAMRWQNNATPNKRVSNGNSTSKTQEQNSILFIPKVNIDKALEVRDK
jgi:hypothetical protein